MATLTPGEQRALNWQAQQLRREAFERALQGKLAAKTNRATLTKKAWDPLIRR